MELGIELQYRVSTETALNVETQAITETLLLSSITKLITLVNKP